MSNIEKFETAKTNPLVESFQKYVEKTKHSMWSEDFDNLAGKKQHVEEFYSPELQSVIEEKLRQALQPIQNELIEVIEKSTPITATGQPELAPAIKEYAQEHLKKAIEQVMSEISREIDTASLSDFSEAESMNQAA